MRTVYVRLSGVRGVQNFVSALSGLSGRFDLTSDQYILDAKSLMGILSLDLTKPLRLTISDDTPKAMEAIMPFIIETATEEVQHGE